MPTLRGRGVVAELSAAAEVALSLSPASWPATTAPGLVAMAAAASPEAGIDSATSRARGAATATL